MIYSHKYPACHFLCLCYSLSHNKITDASADMLLELVSINPSMDSVRWAYMNQCTIIYSDVGASSSQVSEVNTVPHVTVAEWVMFLCSGLFLDSSGTTLRTQLLLRNTSSLKSGESAVSVVVMCWWGNHWCLMIVRWWCVTVLVVDSL